MERGEEERERATPMAFLLIGDTAYHLLILPCLHFFVVLSSCSYIDSIKARSDDVVCMSDKDFWTVWEECSNNIDLER